MKEIKGPTFEQVAADLAEKKPIAFIVAALYREGDREPCVVLSAGSVAQNAYLTKMVEMNCADYLEKAMGPPPPLPSLGANLGTKQ